MLPGFNHNFRYRERLFHVQTEDNGLEDAALVTQVFLDGQVIAIERSSYGDLLMEDLASAERDQKIKNLMQDQHKRLAKALVAGAYDERIKLFQKHAEARPEPGLEPVAEAQSVDLDSGDITVSSEAVASAEFDTWLQAAVASSPVNPGARSHTPLPSSLIHDLATEHQRGDVSQEELLDALEADIRRQLPPRPGSNVARPPLRAVSNESEAPTQPPAPAPRPEAGRMTPPRRQVEPSDTLIDFGLPASLRKEIDMEIALRRAVRGDGAAPGADPSRVAPAAPPRADAKVALFRSAAGARRPDSRPGATPPVSSPPPTEERGAPEARPSASAPPPEVRPAVPTASRPPEASQARPAAPTPARTPAPASQTRPTVPTPGRTPEARRDVRPPASPPRTGEPLAAGAAAPERTRDVPRPSDPPGPPPEPGAAAGARDLTRPSEPPIEPGSGGASRTRDLPRAGEARRTDRQAPRPPARSEVPGKKADSSPPAPSRPEGVAIPVSSDLPSLASRTEPPLATRPAGATGPARPESRPAQPERAAGKRDAATDLDLGQPSAPEPRTVEERAPPRAAAEAPRGPRTIVERDAPVASSSSPRIGEDTRQTLPMGPPPPRQDGAEPPRRPAEVRRAAPREASSPSIVVVERSLDEVILSYLSDDGADSNKR